MNPIEQLPAMQQHRRRSLGLVVVTWLAAMLGGFFLLSRHAATPGQMIHTQSSWPTDTGLVQPARGFTLVMAVHPQCPCSRASINDLDTLMARCNGRLSAIVLFAEAPGLPGDSTHTVLWESASHIPGVKCLRDPGGKLTARFGAETSGQVFLYDSTGDLKFNGGITASRGHAGDNAGTDAVEAVVQGDSPVTDQTPVFGCSIR